MHPVSSTALSGLQAATTRMDVAAHNIANGQTPGFRRQVVQAVSQEGSGVLTSVGQASEVGPDLAADLLAQKQATYQYRANLKTIEAQHQLLGSLLDLKA